MHLLLAIAFLADPKAGPLQIRAAKDPAHVQVIAKLPDSISAKLPRGDVKSKIAERWLAFSIVDEKGKAGPAMFGSYSHRNNTLVFTPRFPLSPNVRYRATLKLGPKTTTADHRIPATKSKPPVVKRIYPSADVLPANNLKFYIVFSEPMREGREIFDHIQLLDDKGNAAPDPWRRVEIWSDNYRQLTLFVHPGRIKTGVNLREEIGPVLEPKRRYRLVITQKVQSVAGVPLAKQIEKPFQTTEPDRQRPLPERWKIIPPTAGTREPLTIRFGESIDHYLLQRMLAVQSVDGKMIKGRITLGKHASQWSFRPTRPWPTSACQIRVDGQLEDLAGNTPLRLFDTDLKRPAASPPRLTLPFTPRQSTR